MTDQLTKPQCCTDLVEPPIDLVVARFGGNYAVRNACHRSAPGITLQYQTISRWLRKGELPEPWGALLRRDYPAAFAPVCRCVAQSWNEIYRPTVEEVKAAAERGK